MLRSLKDLEKYTVSATDGDVGTVVDLLLDDERWTVRYLVVDTEGFLDVHRMLVSPISFREAEWTTGRFQLALSKAKVKGCPSVDLDKPVSRQQEKNQKPEHPEEATGDQHLRSAREVRGYHIEGIDAPIGHVEDFIVDDATWQIRYLVVDTSNWWFGKKVLVAPEWAKRISWAERTVQVDMGRAEIKSGPEWNATAALERGYETQLFDYYGRPAYWNPAPGSPLPRESHSG